MSLIITLAGIIIDKGQLAIILVDTGILSALVLWVVKSIYQIINYTCSKQRLNNIFELCFYACLLGMFTCTMLIKITGLGFMGDIAIIFGLLLIPSLVLYCVSHDNLNDCNCDCEEIPVKIKTVDVEEIKL